MSEQLVCAVCGAVMVRPVRALSHVSDARHEDEHGAYVGRVVTATLEGSTLLTSGN